MSLRATGSLTGMTALDSEPTAMLEIGRGIVDRTTVRLVECVD
jgi:hypothetical protein